jgi:hypothetical protein
MFHQENLEVIISPMMIHKLVLLSDIISYPGEQSGLSSHLNLGLQYLSEILSFYWTHLFPFVNIGEEGG